MLNQLKANYGGDVILCLKAGTESEIASPTTKARLEWAIEEIERLTSEVETARMDGFQDGWRGAEDWFAL